jgi:hypothetical protein
MLNFFIFDGSINAAVIFTAFHLLRILKNIIYPSFSTSSLVLSSSELYNLFRLVYKVLFMTSQIVRVVILLLPRLYSIILYVHIRTPTYTHAQGQTETSLQGGSLLRPGAENVA